MQQRANALTYVAPLTVFIGLSAALNYGPRVWYGWLYAGTLGATLVTLYFCRVPWREMQPDKRVLLPAILVGLIVFVEWITVNEYIPYPHLGQRVAFNPFAEIKQPLALYLFLLVRYCGLVLVVPVIEELFWRSFLLRYLTHADFETVPLGSFSWSALGISAGAFGLTHPEWLSAIICALCYSWLLHRTRSLFACVLAHASTNLLLGIYVMLTHHWLYW